MIKVDRGNVEISGEEAVIRAEFCVMCRSIREVLGERYGEEAAERKIRNDFEDTFIPQEELAKRAHEEMKKLIGDNPAKLVELLKEAFNIG